MSISIALTKEHLERVTMKLLKERGYGIESLKDKGRALVFQDSKKDIHYFLVKSGDCVTYIRHGVADIGVVGEDMPLEGGKDYYEMLGLGIRKCKFIVAGLQECNLFDKVGHVKVGTKCPNIIKQYFLEKGIDAGCIKIDGSVELAPVLDLCDGIVDIMEMETTLKGNGLIVFDTICDISARVIVNKASFKLKRAEILATLEDMKKGLEAC